MIITKKKKIEDILKSLEGSRPSSVRSAQYSSARGSM
jgi:hypothetical protein